MTLPEPEKISALMALIAPGCRILSVEALNLGFHNRSFRVDITRPDGSPAGYVVKRYAV